MKNKKALIGAAIVMLLVAVACVLSVVVLTRPDTNNVTSGDSFDVIVNNSTDISNSYGNENSIDDTSVDSVEIEESSEEYIPPELVLPPDTVLYSQIAAVYDVSEGVTIFQRETDLQTAPASLTKLVTALVALDHLNPSQRITVGDEIDMIGPNSSIAFLAVGQRYNVSTLIDALLIPSGNDAAYVLAVNTARVAANDMSLSKESAVSDFVRMMNEKVKGLGCSGTLFTSPDGYDAEGQATTAEDMIKICLQAYNNSSIKASVCKEKSSGWENSNLLVRTDSSLYNEAVNGLKTGSTASAGYCVAVSAVVEEKTYIMVFMNSATSDGRFKDANTIISLLRGDVADETTEEASA